MSVGVRSALVVLPVLLGGVFGFACGTTTSSSTTNTGGTGSFVLTATNRGPEYAPTFTGNGELGIRVPPIGEGYATGSVPTTAQLAGFYAKQAGGVQQRANLPNWSTLTFSEGSQAFGLASGRVAHWRQSIDLRTGVITTTETWTAPDGHVTKISYAVLTDRARPDVGLVRLTVKPEWSGVATVTDSIDGSDSTLSSEVSKGSDPSLHEDWVEVSAEGTGVEVALSSELVASTVVESVTPNSDEATGQSLGQSAAQSVRFAVSSGRTYEVTKYVGIVSSQESGAPVAAAESQSSAATRAGFGSLLAANDAAWSKLWSGRVDVIGDGTLASEVNASEFYLWASTRDGVDWSISPGGLSSNGYNGHVFWDADTWMFPALLAQHPDLAQGIDDYRYARLGAAETHAQATGYLGSRFPWESALDGTEQIPPPSSLFTEGLYEQHITADVAIAQWQYYLATGDKAWLKDRGWPVISEAAAFWASRVVAGPGDTYHIDGVTGPDEENADVDDEAYTNAAAAVSLEDAVSAAGVLGVAAPSDWAKIASGLVVPTIPSLDVTPEFSGYQGALVKQADATLLLYPLGYAISKDVARNDLDYYAPRTDPNGPSMSDAINAIDNSALGDTGCASYVYTLRSVQPFIHDVFDQFSETKGGGVLTFMTGIGGFLQEFLYGYTGFRWTSDVVQLSPSLSGQIRGVVVHDMKWHGRSFTVSIGRSSTTVSVNGGGRLPLRVGSRVELVATGHSITIATRRAVSSNRDDMDLCASASATSAQPGHPPLAAVDGSPATDWQPSATPATLTVELPGQARTLDGATVEWGERWPSAPSLTQPPPPGPVVVARPTSYILSASVDGRTWRTLATVDRTEGATDSLHFASMKARYVRVRIVSSSGQEPPMLDELTVDR